MQNGFERAAIALGAIAAACATTTAPGTGQWKIDYGLLLPTLSVARVLEIPATVVARQAVPVTVNTFGSSSCLRPAGVEISGAGTQLQILTPRDSVALPGAATACTDDLATRPHPTVLTFEQAGTATVRVRGYLAQSDGTRRLGTLDWQVTVRP